jgi:Fe-S-cluster containining protein
MAAAAQSDRRPSPELPTVAALDRLWHLVTRRPLWAPPHFFRYLRLRAENRLTLIDFDRVSLLTHHWKINDCACCTDICCVGKRSTVLLRLRDIAMLMDLGRTDLISSAKPTFSADELAARPALRRNISSRAWSTFPVLAQDRRGACRALTDQGKCALYPHWPLSCARFPYAFHAGGSLVFFSPRCRSFWIRNDVADRVNAMARAAVAAYNERIKDVILLAYARERLGELGLLGHLCWSFHTGA